MANYTSGHDRSSRFPNSRQNSTNKLASLKARDKLRYIASKTLGQWFDEWIDNNRIYAILYIIAQLRSRILFIHLSPYLVLSFSRHFPPCSSFHQPVGPYSSFHVRSSKASFLFLPSSPLVRVSTFKICSRLPRRDVDARYSGYRVTSSSQCSEINSSSGKMLLLGLFLSSTSFNLHLSLSSSSWPAVIRTQFDDYCVTDKHQSGKLVGQFKFAPLGNVTLVTRWINERGEFLARSLA